ncbi:unnamed protein product [Brassica napus]|uniref:(rape) hypothetical protein n=1 Tax=Brassica napus TaxID=3708 RepID=A0A816SQE7_BRANA|nr:unnamed protein product [Brassica napus]
MCMATGGEDSPEVQNVGWEYGLVKPKGAIRPDGWAYRFPTTNTTILYYWSASLSDLVPMNNTDPPRLTAMHLDRPPAFMRNYLHRFDVLVLNTGHHWNRGKIEGNHWVMHVNGTQVEGEFLKDIKDAKDFTIRSVAKWLDAQLPLHPQLKAFLGRYLRGILETEIGTQVGTVTTRFLCLEEARSQGMLMDRLIRRWRVL